MLAVPIPRFDRITFMIKLHADYNNHKSEYKCDGDCSIVIGREHTCGFTINDPMVSRVHMLMGINGNQVRICDLKSKRGVYVNGDLIKASVVVKAGDIIRIGSTTISLSADGIAPVQGIEKNEDKPGYSICQRCFVEVAGDNVCQDCRQQIEEKREFIPGYVMKRQIGRGGIADIYLAEHYIDEEYKAIKVFRENLSDNDIKMFNTESDSLKKLNHKNIVKYYHSASFDKKLYIVLEFVQGKILSKYFMGKPTIKELAPTIEQVCDALIYAHDLKIIHRDIKPENIMIDESYLDHQAKILDFGIARNLEKSGISDLTKTGNIKGTFLYMAPEQVQRSSQAIDQRTDIFALGAVIYNLLTGKYPFDFPDDVDINSGIQTILTKEIVPIQDRIPDINPQLADFINKAVAKNQTDRFQNVIEMKSEMKKVVSTL